MTRSKKDIELIKRRAVVVDACLLMSVLHSKEFFSEFFEFIYKLKSIPVVASPVYCEIVRGLPGDQQIEDIRCGTYIERWAYGINFLQKFGREVDIDERTLDNAKMLFNINALAVSSGKYAEWYKCQPSPSYVDMLIGALSFRKNTVVVTSDHKDFPLYLYDRLYLKTFDLKDEIITIGFYKINFDKYMSLIDFVAKAIKNSKNRVRKK